MLHSGSEVLKRRSKMATLKKLIAEMQRLMAQGDGDDAEAGMEAMEEMGDGAMDAPEEGLEESPELPEEEMGSDMGMPAEDEFKAMKMRDFKRPSKIKPKKGTAVAVSIGIGKPKTKGPMYPKK